MNILKILQQRLKSIGFQRLALTLKLENLKAFVFVLLMLNFCEKKQYSGRDTSSQMALPYV